MGIGDWDWELDIKDFIIKIYLFLKVRYDIKK